MHTTPSASKLLKGLIVAAALASASFVQAQDRSTVASAPTPEMARAFAKAAQGPDQLRWFVQRTQTIYALNYHDVMNRFEQSKIASQDASPVLAKAETK